MVLCPATNKPDADLVYTPDHYAVAIVEYYKPQGRILEPCRGGGAFTRAMPTAEWCELQEGKDFLKHEGQYDWLITNPPWSKIKHFLDHAVKLQIPNIVLLVNFNALTTKARLRSIYQAGYSIKELLCLPTPKAFPQMGFQLAAVHIVKQPNQQIKVTFKDLPL